MIIKFNCKSCGQRFSVDETDAGVTVPCPKCGVTLSVPKATTVEPTPELAPPTLDQPKTSEPSIPAQLSTTVPLTLDSPRITSPPTPTQPNTTATPTLTEPIPTALPTLVKPGTDASPKIPAKPPLPVAPSSVTKGKMRFSAAIQCIAWLICLGVLVIGGLLFCLALADANGAPQQEAAGAVFATCFIGAYVLARIVEKICNLMERK
jgi:hypothetical protein